MLDFIDSTVIPFVLDLYDAVGYVGVAMAVALETIVAPIPSEVILPMAGWKVSQSAADPSVVEPLTGAAWNIPLAVALATVGSLVGALVGYYIGAWGGRPLLDRYGRYVGSGAEAFAYAHGFEKTHLLTPQAEPGTWHDPERDATTLPLVSRAMASAMCSPTRSWRTMIGRMPARAAYSRM